MVGRGDRLRYFFGMYPFAFPFWILAQEPCVAVTITFVPFATLVFGAEVDGLAYTHVVLFKYAVTPPAALRVDNTCHMTHSVSITASATIIFCFMRVLLYQYFTYEITHYYLSFWIMKAQ